uniref:Reverse transcriptase Ty1/copia-type domain-containing protein n=1 Tax=Tanacetum cinerariifolium TaxID=118510 RepID=A0A6L2LWB9_TANCI|nr:hypothetical protein [Tanacetum cinerariifolium]
MTKNVTNYEPKKVIQALIDPSWIKAMHDELLQFKLQQVWTLVHLPYGKRAIGTKWIYRNKKDERGSVVRNKARLVAQGYTQEERIDNDEIFALSAFLYGKIEEEVYVCQPLGFEDPEFPDRVYKVEKALYGLDQAPKAWYKTLSTYLLDNGFHRDEAVYEEMYDSVERTATTATGLDAEQDRGIISKTQFTATLNEPSSIGTSSGSRPRRQETMGDVATQTRRMHPNRGGSLIIDADEGVTLVNETQGRNDQDMFDTGSFDDEEVSTIDPVTTAGEVVTTVGVKVSVAATTPIISMDDITLAKALAALKSAKPMIKEPSIPVSGFSISPKVSVVSTTSTTVTTTTTTPRAKGIKKDQIMIDEEVARNLEAQLQDELEEEERFARQKEKEANIALLAEWDDVQAMMDADHELAERLQAEEQGELTVEGKSKLFMELKLDEKVEAKEDNDQEEAEMKMYMKIVFDGDVAIDAIPLATKPPIIVDWKIIKERKISSYHIIRHDGSLKRYSSMIQMLQHIDREDLETLWKLVKAKYRNTRPEEAYERVL